MDTGENAVRGRIPNFRMRTLFREAVKAWFVNQQGPDRFPEDFLPRI